MGDGLNGQDRRRRALRGTGAVFAGMGAAVTLSIVTDLLLHGAQVLPPPGEAMTDAVAVLALVYRTLYGVAGAYLTARFAPDRPMRHALALGALGLVVSAVGAVATWDRGPAFGPHWYPLALVVTAVPCAWAGGRLYRLYSLRSVEAIRPGGAR